MSKVTPVFKRRALSDPSNYRPIATLSPFTKALERVIYDQTNFMLLTSPRKKVAPTKVSKNIGILYKLRH